MDMHIFLFIVLFEIGNILLTETASAKVCQFI